ncbi:MAG: hypothetical protein GC189_13615 [Alphaproteobacteria bacterium]|nr:hypothetical protein [Alphaproteobacteria bacterium]
MGEAKRKKRLRAQLLEDNPVCIYCTASSETVEHMPPVIMFTRRQRPKGLEFASCEACNGGTKHADLVAAYIGRSMMQASGEAETEDLLAILQALRNNLPDLLLEMRPSPDQLTIAERELAGQKVLNVGGPLAAGFMRQFAIKLTFALYREISGRAVPESGGVLARWFSNYEARTGRVPPDVFQNLLPPRSLRQGTFDVSDQFAYSFEISPDGDFAR